eukprot:5636433-Alexandrium_andersonii.AAC.1
MSASLVGSEMCIRDRRQDSGTLHHPCWSAWQKQQGFSRELQLGRAKVWASSAQSALISVQAIFRWRGRPLRLAR